MDDHTARATLVDRTLSVTMQVSFDAAGLIRSARFEARGALVLYSLLGLRTTSR